MPETMVPETESPSVEAPSATRVVVDFPGWQAEAPDGDEQVWQGPGGAILNLTVRTSAEIPATWNQVELQRLFREMAEERKGGLVEAKSPDGWASHGIYKQPLGMGFLFTGMLFMPMDRATLVWTCVSGERGTTGVREANVAGELIQKGVLTLEEYKRSWAADPYDEEYRASGRVEPQVLRYMSDGEEYDAEFPDHPLSVVRRTLGDVLQRVVVSDSTFGGKRRL